MQLEIPEAFGDLFTPSRFKVFYGGRGAAKSESFGRALLAKGMAKPEGILCARELQVSMADSVHALLEHTINSIPEFAAFYKVGQKEIRGRNGTFFIFKGLKHNISEIKSTHGITICWVEEAQVVSDKSWETLIPTIRENGSEIWLSFNTKNPTDPTYQRFVLRKRDNAIVRKVSWRDNPWFPDVLEQERKDLIAEDKDAYDHVWEGEFDTRYSGSVYAKYIKQEQISDRVTYDPNRPIYTSWDLGYDDATAVLFYQIAKNEVHVIDYYESNFEDIKHYCEILYGCEIIVDDRSLQTGKVLRWHFGDRFDDDKASYNYLGGKHYVPHDAANKLQAAAGRSIVEQAMEYGVSLHVIKSCGQQDSEAATRKTLPRTWFNADKTRDLVHALMNYHYEYDEDKKIYGKVPLHDWSSHGADATELMARMWQDAGASMAEIIRDDKTARFHRYKAKYDPGERDPYRLRKKA
jgi:phage terminase large subunit